MYVRFKYSTRTGRPYRHPKCLENRGIRVASVDTLVELCSLDNWKSPLRCDVEPPSERGIIVALGKFDAMHRGHRALAMQAAALGGYPFLLSFSGIAESLGKPVTEPLVAACDRPRVLSSWTSLCNNRCPRQRYIPFCEIRNMSPDEFVKLLATDLMAKGIVAGANYRFGYRAKGDAEMLETLGKKYGLQVSIVDLVSDVIVGDKGPVQVSSSKIRELLSLGDLANVQQCLGRPYRLVLLQPADSRGQGAVTLPLSSCLNAAPSPGVYQASVFSVPSKLPLNSQNGSGGNVAYSTLPVGGPLAWRAANVDTLRSSDGSLPLSRPTLVSISSSHVSLDCHLDISDSNSSRLIVIDFNIH